MKRIAITLALLGAAIAAGPAAAAQPSEVAFTVQVTLAGDLTASVTRGTFTASGAVADSGTESGAGWFAGQGHLKTGEPNALHSYIWLHGGEGSIRISLTALVGQLPAPIAEGSGRWMVSDGTGAYAGLHGTGTLTLVADFRDAFAGLGPPRVTLQLLGRVG